MITRRFFATGLAAAAGLVLGSPAQAGSILDLFAPPEEPVRIVKKRKLPASIKASQAPRKKIVAKKASVKKVAKAGKKKSSAKPFKIDPIYEPQEVAYLGPQQPGEIVIKSNERFLYLVQSGGRARRYGVAIGQEGLGWRGNAVIKSKVEWPSWTPTPDMIKRAPNKYARYKDGMPGGPGNPLGARALYFYQGKRDTAIRIHGTTQPWTIGQAASNGCFRMVNEHVIDLYNRVRLGTKVTVI